MSTARTATRRGIASIYPRTIHPTEIKDRAHLARRIFTVAKGASEWPFGKEPLSASRNVVQHWNYYGKVPADMDIQETNRIVDLIELDLNRRQALRDEKKFLRNEDAPEFGQEDRIQAALWLKAIEECQRFEYPFCGPKLYIAKEDLHNWACNTNDNGELRGVPKRYDLIELLAAAYDILMNPKRPILFKTQTRKNLEIEIRENLLLLRGVKTEELDSVESAIKTLMALEACGVKVSFIPAVKVLVEKFQELKKES